MAERQGHWAIRWINPSIRTPLRRIVKFTVRLPSLVATGQCSPGLATLYSRWRWRRPRTTLEKVRYKMAFDRRPLITTFADKLEARKYVQDRLEKNRLTRVYSVAESFAGLDWTAVPEEFVVKVNHGSGGMVCVTTMADPSNRLPGLDVEKPWKRYFVHPESLDWERLTGWVHYWLENRYRWRRWDYREWAYGQVRPRVFVEEFLGGNRVAARNLKLHCFAGTVGTIAVTSYQPDGTEFAEERFLAHEISEAATLAGVDRDALSRVVSDSETLSRETDFVRVDWLISSKGIKFGELTSYPAGGNSPSQGTNRLSAEALASLYSTLWGPPPDYRLLPQGKYPWR